MSFLEKVDALKKQTFTNEKIAETLKCSLSTVKRGLVKIRQGVLISSTRKWALTGDVIFFYEMFEEVRLRAKVQEPDWVGKAKASLAGRYGAELYYVAILDPDNDIERNWVKRYKKAVKEGRTVSEGF